MSAQTAETALAGSTMRSAGSAPFLVAPTIALGYAPSSVASGDLRHSGKLDLVTSDFSAGQITVFLGTGQGKFAAGVEYAAGAEPGSVLVADVNGDGRPDVVVANQSAGTVSVLLGKGDGTFEARQAYSVGFNPSFVAIGNFGGNGGMDLAVAGAAKNLLAVLLNDGSGKFARPVTSSLSKTPTALAAADFNGDGRSDLALGNSDGTVSILLGKDKAQFNPLADVKVSSGSLSALAAADLKKDGKIDLIATQSGQKLVSVLAGNGDGTFAVPVSYAVGHAPVSAVVADVNGDDIADLVVVNSQSNTFSVLNGNGDGTFQASRDFVSGNGPLAAVAGDFYGSGHVDLAVINHSAQTVSLPSGNGDGTFKAGRSYVSGQQPVSIASGILNNSIKPGLVVANYCGSDVSCSSTGNVSVFLPDASGAYHLSASYNVGAGPVSVALADVNGDKKLDIVAANRLEKTVTVLLGAGDGTFREPATIPLGAAPVAIAVGDFNKDGLPDLAVLEDCGAATCSGRSSVEILAGAEGGTFKSQASYPVGYGANSLAVGDLKGDKNLDIVVANRCGSDASCQSAGTGSVLLGDGSGKFSAGTAVTLGKSPSSIALGNLSGSGLDLVVSRSADNTVAVLKGNGDGTFGAAVAYPVGNKPGSVVVSDFNGDGLADVAVSNFTDSTVSVLYGRGDSTLQAASAVPVGANPVAMTAVTGAFGGRATLATADGSTAADSPGTEFSMSPDGPGSNFTSFTLAATPTPSDVNATVQLQASIVTPSPTAPPSNVVFSVGSTALSDCGGSTGEPVTGTGTAYTSTCNTAMLDAGASQTISAEYIGDVVYNQQTATTTQTVDALAATIGVTSGGASNVNGPVTFTAQLAGGVAFTPINPDGFVDFMVGTTTITGCGAVQVDAAGAAQCPVTSSALLVAPSDTINVSYSGDNNFTVAANGTTTQTVNALAATLGLTSSGPSTVNGGVTFTAQLGGGVALSPVNPNGFVNFMVGTTTITGCGAVQVNATGQAQCTVTTSSLLIPPSVTINASYSGDTNFTVATNGTMTQTVNPAAATLGLTSGGASSVNGPVTFTAQLATAPLTPVTPNGFVNFMVGTTTITGCGAVQVNTSGRAQCAVTSSSLLIGPSNTINASYTGDTNFTVATNGTMTQTVNPLADTIGVSSSGASSVNGPVTFTAQLGNGVALTPVTPSGKVNFTVGATTITGCGAVTVNATGAAQCVVTSSALLVAPSDTINASYSGDPSFTVATAGTTTQTVAKLSPTVNLTVSPTGSVAVGSSVTFTAQLTGVTLTPVTPGGTVNFTANGVTITGCGAVTVSASGAAACPTSSMVAPADIISAVYTGDNNFNGATSNSLAETVTRSTPGVTVSGTPTTAAVNQSVTYTATVKATSGTVLPTGSVTFTLTTGGTVICNSVSVTPATGIATCNYAFLAPASPGTTVTASYSGDSNFNTASGVTAAPEVVTMAGTTTAITNATPSPSSVNQQVTFTATVTPAFTGSTLPSGTVTFTDTTSAVTMCTVTLSGGIVPVCNYTFPANGSQAVTATYNGDPNFVTSVSSSFNQSVGASTTTVILTSGPNPATVNQSVTFTATISTNSGSTTPQGTVVYTDTTTSATLCTVTLSGSGTVPACAASFATFGVHKVTAAFTSSNSNFSSATSSALSETVNATSTSTALTSAPSSSSVNQTVVFTAVVTPAFTGTAKPTGTVTFTDSTTATTLCSGVTLTAAGTAACSSSFTATGSQSVVATYTTGDTNFTGSASTPLTQSVGTDPTTTAITSSAASATVNQVVTFTATITPSFTGTKTPSGTVAFTYTVGGGSPVTLCAASTVSASGSGGTATCAQPFAANGNYTVTATYSSDASFAASSGSVLQPVGLTPTTTAVAASPTTSAVNQSVLFTATVTPSTTGSTNPTGSVTFTYSFSGGPSVILCSGAALTAATGKATCTGTLPSAGSYAVTASYSGDTNFGSSNNSGNLSFTVTQPTTTLGLTSSPTTSVVNQPVAFTAVITPGFTGGTLPTGTVTFTDTSNSTTLCTSNVSVTGTVPACSFAFLTAGTHTVTATYSGDTNFPRTTSGVVSEAVSQTTTATTVSGSPSSSSVNQSVTFTATVLPTVSGTTIPTGTVAFTYVLNGGSSVTMCAASTLSNLGIATCTLPLPSQGAYTVTATYSGDTNFKTSLGTTPQSVAGSPTTTTVVASPNPSNVNQQVLFTATVKTTVTGSTSPTGTVAFTYSLNGGAAVTLCSAATVTPATGVATCLQPLPTAAPSTAPYVVTAKYSGDNNFVTSTNTVNQTVNPANLTIVVSSSQATSLVNQAVTFTATLTVANSGVAQPASTVAFKDTLTGATLCSDNALTSAGNGVYTASCSPPVTNLWIAGTHPITATYNGDPNFPATTSAVFAQVVKATPTGATVVSSLPVSIATETVTFTATVTPTAIGPVVPSGYFTFTSSGTWSPAASCQAAPVAPITSGTGAGTATATCTATFPSTASSQSITAVYSNDPNFTTSTSVVAETVANFSIANSVTSTQNTTPSAGPVVLTQGYATAAKATAGTDPFNPTTVKVVVTSSGGFTDTLNVNCVVTNSTHAVVTDPSCIMSTTNTPPTSTTMSGATGTSLIYTLSASATAPVGAYTVTLSAADVSTPALATLAAPLTLSIIGVANPLSLAQGASGQENVSFNTFSAPQADTFSSVACGTVVPLVSGVAGTPVSNPAVSCTSTIPAGGIPIISGGVTTVPVSISTSTKAAGLARSSNISLAALFGVPLLALMGWVGSRKSPRKNFFRFLGLILLLVGVSYASGCGGSFTSTSTTSTTGLAAGNYLVQVVGTDQNGNNYYAAIPLDVSAN